MNKTGGGVLLKEKHASWLLGAKLLALETCIWVTLYWLNKIYLLICLHINTYMNTEQWIIKGNKFEGEQVCLYEMVWKKKTEGRNIVYKLKYQKMKQNVYYVCCIHRESNSVEGLKSNLTAVLTMKAKVDWFILLLIKIFNTLEPDLFRSTLEAWMRFWGPYPVLWVPHFYLREFL